jgi:hypothetical protein
MKVVPQALALLMLLPQYAATQGIDEKLISALRTRAANVLAARLAGMAKSVVPDHPCPDGKTACRVPITIAASKDANNVIRCEAGAPNLHFPGADNDNNPKRIVWEIDQKPVWLNKKGDPWNESTDGPMPVGSFEFVEPNMILASDPHQQITLGKQGDDDDRAGRPTSFHARNRHKIVGAASVYLPLIIFNPSRSDTPSLCGAPDPLITNAP